MPEYNHIEQGLTQRIESAVDIKVHVILGTVFVNVTMNEGNNELKCSYTCVYINVFCTC